MRRSSCDHQSLFVGIIKKADRQTEEKQNKKEKKEKNKKENQ